MAGGVSVRDVDVSLPLWSPPRSFQRFLQSPLSRSSTSIRSAFAPRTMMANSCFHGQAQKFVEAYSAFLKRQGKLPVPGPSVVRSTSKQPCISRAFRSDGFPWHLGWVDTVKTSPAKELPPQSIDWYLFPWGNQASQTLMYTLLIAGITPAPPQSHVMSISERLSALAGYARFTAAPKTAAHDHHITLTQAEV